MKIDKNVVTQDRSVQRVSTTETSNRESVSNSPRTFSSSDQVELSSTSREIESLTAAVRVAPDVRLDKVNEVKQAMHDGTYNVSAAQIAEKIISGG